MSMNLKDDILNAVRDSKIKNTCRSKTPKFRKPTVPPQPTVPPMPPTSGSNAKKPCPYETPCGWCTKWDKKCNRKIGHQSDTTQHPEHVYSAFRIEVCSNCALNRDCLKDPEDIVTCKKFKYRNELKEN